MSHASEPPTQEHHAGGELRRRLTVVSNASMTYTTVGASLGTFAFFSLLLTSSGPAGIWGWFVVAVPVLIILTQFAQLASQYPYAGVMYEWPRILAGRHVGWWVGWIYLFAGGVTLSALYFTFAQVALPILGLENSVRNQIFCAVFVLVLSVVVNVLGIELLGSLSKYAVVAEIAAMVGVVSLVLIFGHEGSLQNVLDTGGHGGFGPWLPGFVGGALFTGIFVMYTFENSATLGEETVDAPKQAPRAIFGSYIFTVIMGAYFLIVFAIRIPNVGEAQGAEFPALYVMGHALPSWWQTVFLILLLDLAFLGPNVMMAAVARQMLGMARGGELPFSTALARLNSRGVPTTAILVCGVVSAVPLLFAAGFVVIAAGACAAMYVVYLSVLVTLLWARLRRGWPVAPAPFGLGKWGVVLNVLAIISAVAILVNVLWVRPATNPIWHLGIPVAWWMIGLSVVLGGLYYGLVQYRRIRDDGDNTLPVGAAADLMPEKQTASES